MNPRERVLAALNHQVPDRIPIDIAMDDLSPALETGLRTHFMVKDSEAVKLGLGIDVRWVQPVNHRLSKDPEQAGLNWFATTQGLQSYADGFGLRPLQHVASIADVERHPWPNADWFDYDTVATLAGQYGSYAIIAPMTWSPLFCRIAELCGMERTLTLMVDDPVLIDAMVEHIMAFYLEYYRRLLDAALGRIDIAYMGDDPAGQERMLFSLDMWRRFFKKPYARLFQVAKDRGVRVMFHICGAATELVPDLLDIGMDVLMPLQFRAARMDPTELKARYGRCLCFYGGVDTQHTLPYGTAAEVRTEVRRLIEILGADGGYILASSHSLLDDVPLANVLAMYNEACRYGTGTNAWRSSGRSQS